MPTEYNLSPVYHIVFRDVLGVPASNGTVSTFKAVSHTTPKAVFEDKAGTISFDNPIQLNAAGVVADDTGAPKAIYWASDEDYYIVVKDSVGTIIQTIDNYNAPVNDIPTPQVNEVDFSNYVLNAQFRLFQKRKYLSSELPASPTKVAEEEWFFFRSNTNTISDVQIIEFLAGQTDVPNNPQNYMQIDCTGVGVGGETSKFIEHVLGSVETFNGEEISFGFWAKANALNPIGYNVEIEVSQFFGSGGSSQVNTILATFTLTANWAQYTFENVSIPSISGKTVKPGNEFVLKIKVAPNEILIVDFTNIQINRGNVLLEFDYKSKNLDDIDRHSFDLPSVPDLKKHYESRTLKINDSREIVWDGGIAYIGSTLLSFREDTIPGWLLCRGEAVSRWRYAALYNVYPGIFGLPDESMTASRSTAVVTTNNVTAGTVTDASDNDTGFSFSNSSQYNFTPTVSSNVVTITNDDVGDVLDIADGSGTWKFSPTVLTDVVTITNNANGNVTNIADGNVDWDFTPSTHDATRELRITNGSVGVVPAPTDGITPLDTGFYLTVLTLGTPGAAQVIRIRPNTVTAKPLVGGEYFTFHSITHAFYIWYSVNGNGADPAIPGHRGIGVKVISADDPVDIVNKTHTAIQSSTDFTFATTQQGTGALPEISTITTKVGTNKPLVGGEYFLFSSTTHNFLAYYIVNGIGDQQPLDTKIRLPIAIGSADSADTIASKTKIAIEKATDFVFAVTQQGTGSVAEISTITTTAATSKPLLGGEYFVFASTTTTFVPWYRIDELRGAAPSVGGTKIQIDITSSETADQIAAKTREQLWGKHKVTITCNPGSELNGGEYFKIYGKSDLETKFYVWFRKDGIGIDPAPATFTEILIDISEDDTNAVVAEKLEASLQHLVWSLPDPRGLFLRIQDNGAAIDPDAADRTDRGDGTDGDNPGTIQQDELGSHHHNAAAALTKNGAIIEAPYTYGTENYLPTTDTGGSETRAKNIYLNMYMKY